MLQNIKKSKSLFDLKQKKVLNCRFNIATNNSPQFSKKHAEIAKIKKIAVFHGQIFIIKIFLLPLHRFLCDVCALHAYTGIFYLGKITQLNQLI